MTRVRWTSAARSDLSRCHEFLKPVNRQAAARVAQMLQAAPVRLIDHPRIGPQLEEFAPREVRRLIVGHYELRYEVTPTTILVLRLWHTRESR